MQMPRFTCIESGKRSLLTSVLALMSAVMLCRKGFRTTGSPASRSQFCAHVDIPAPLVICHLLPLHGRARTVSQALADMADSCPCCAVSIQSRQLHSVACRACRHSPAACCSTRPPSTCCSWTLGRSRQTWAPGNPASRVGHPFTLGMSV